jgi:hypothetical protein
MIGERRMLIVMKSRYNMRKEQSQVKEKADAVLARTDAFNFIWRANATKECFAFLECEEFRWALPEKQAAAKQTFVFHTLLTCKQSAKRTKERCKRGFASVNALATNAGQMTEYTESARAAKTTNAVHFAFGTSRWAFDTRVCE